MLSVTNKPFMLSVTDTPSMLSVIVLNGIMLNVVVQFVRIVQTGVPRKDSTT